MSKHISIPLSEFLSTLFHDDGNIRRQPIRSVDQQLLDGFYPTKVSAAVGKLLLQEDPQETYVHVELFESHAEIYRISHWQESGAKLSQLRKQSVISNKLYRWYNDLLNLTINKLLMLLGMKNANEVRELALYIIETRDAFMWERLHLETSIPNITEEEARYIRTKEEQKIYKLLKDKYYGTN
jgi:hypothetical protein